MGGHRLACDECDATTIHDHACRDRHCPRCQRGASEHWCERQRANVLPVRALSRHVRGGFVSRLRQAINDGKFSRLSDSIEPMLDALMAKE